jgi:hypothetical protein
MAGGGSSELRSLQLAVGSLQARIEALERQVAGLQSALKGGDVAPAAGPRAEKPVKRGK